MSLINLICPFLLAGTVFGAPSPQLDKRAVPAMVYPPGGFKENCPESYTNLFYQGIQKRDVDGSSSFPFFEEVKPFNYTMPPEAEVEELRRRSLEPRQYKSCANIARFDWQGFSRPLGNTQDLYLSKGSTYTFSITCSVNIKLAYAWTAPYSSGTYTLVATGGMGQQTATVMVPVMEDSHVHFQAFSDSTMSDGAVAVFKQDM